MGARSKNYGIIMTGGELSGDQIAVGEGAQANKFVSARPAGAEEEELQRIWQHLGLLQDALKANKHEFRNARELLASTREVADQLTLDRPDKTRVLPLVDRILSGVKSGSTLSGLVGTLKKLILAHLVD